MNSNNEGDHRIYELFKLVFNNIVIFKNIFKYVRLYKKNEKVEIKSRDELRLYKEREYIQSLIYSGEEMLIEGDLPNNTDGGYVLKEIEFKKSNLSKIKGESIPNGVEILKFNPSFNYRTTPLSTLPNSIHTVKNVIIFKPTMSIFDNYHEYFELSNHGFNIPSNIKSISFQECPSISKNELYSNFITIPNTVEKLEFTSSWNNQNIELSKGDIPEGVTSLIMQAYKKNLKNGVLPSTLKEVNLNFNKSVITTGGGSGVVVSFDEILSINSIESLSISDCTFNINSNLKLNQFLKINKLHINYSQDNLSIDSFSLPPNLIELSIINNRGMDWGIPKINFSKDSIPSSVKILKINSIIIQPDILPESLLTTIEILYHKESIFKKQSVSKMIELLPSSLTLLKLPRSLKEMNLDIPKNINVIYNAFDF